MSNYNSTNTMVLATHVQSGGNTRMLLMHRMDDPKLGYEYVIGSYFTIETNLGDPFDKEGPAFINSYSWDWGHYFTDIVNAVDYWKNDVLGENLATKQHRFETTMKSEDWDYLGVYEDDGLSAVGAFVDFCTSGNVPGKTRKEGSMNYSELTTEQKNELAGNYLCRLADEGNYAEVMGVEWDAPSWGELASAIDLVPEDVMEREFGDYWFTEDDFCC